MMMRILIADTRVMVGNSDGVWKLRFRLLSVNIISRDLDRLPLSRSPVIPEIKFVNNTTPSGNYMPFGTIPQERYNLLLATVPWHLAGIFGEEISRAKKENRKQNKSKRCYCHIITELELADPDWNLLGSLMVSQLSPRRITPQSKQLGPISCPKAYFFEKFQANSSITCWIILLTHGQTNQQRTKTKT